MKKRVKCTHLVHEDAVKVIAIATSVRSKLSPFGDRLDGFLAVVRDEDLIVLNNASKAKLA